jgi:hypothetical protein
MFPRNLPPYQLLWVWHLNLNALRGLEPFVALRAILVLRECGVWVPLQERINPQNFHGPGHGGCWSIWLSRYKKTLKAMYLKRKARA